MNPKHRIAIQFADLEDAFETASDEVRFYLDLETGKVVSITAEIREELESVYTEVYDEQEEEVVTFDHALQQHDLPEWMRPIVQEAHQVEQGYGMRFISIPATDSRERYRDMERFIDTVHDSRLQSILQHAIQGRGAFRRFRDTLLAYQHERECWFAFSAARVRERVLEWLEAEEIEVSTE